MSKVLTKITSAHNGSGIWSVDWLKDTILTGSMAAASSTSTNTSSIKLWSVAGTALTGVKPQTIATLGTSSQHLLGITSAQLSRTDPLAFTASLDGAIHFWDISVLRSPVLKASAAAGPSGALCMAQRPLGRLVATGGRGGKVKLWDVNDGTLKNSGDVTSGINYVTSLGWNKANDVIACGTNDGKIHLFGSEDFSRVNGGNGFSSHSKTVRKVFFGGEKGDLLFSAGDDGLVNVHDVRMGGSNAVVATYGGHRGKVLTVTATQDGVLCATGGSDAVVKVWDARASWKERNAFYEHKDSVWDLAFSEDKTMLASVSDDGAMIIYSTI